MPVLGWTNRSNVKYRRSWERLLTTGVLRPIIAPSTTLDIDMTTKVNDIALIEIFEDLYPNPSSELNFSNDFELVVAVVLSAQCTDKKVNQVTTDLFTSFPDFISLGLAKVSSVENIIRPINYYKTKAKNIISLSKIVVNEFNSELPKSFDQLMSLPGVGRKTASVVLGELGIDKTFPVDTHVFRVSKRLGLAKGSTPDEIEVKLRKRFDSSLWRKLHHWLIFHGRRVCKARAPNCQACKLNQFCPRVGLSKISSAQRSNSEIGSSDSKTTDSPSAKRATPR